MAKATIFDAEAYDIQILKTIPLYSQLQQQVLDVALSAGNEVGAWLDIGCGTGSLVRQAADALAGTVFTLCDVDPAMLEVARERLDDVRDVQYIEARFGEALLERQYDVVTAVQVLHYTPGEERLPLLRKVYECLCPGGVFVMVNNTDFDTLRGREMTLRRWRDWQVAQGKAPAEADAHVARFGREYFPLTVGRQLEDLRAAGFATAELFWRCGIQAGFFAVK